jgi:hypothetical protein
MSLNRVMWFKKEKIKGFHILRTLNVTVNTIFFYVISNCIFANISQSFNISVLV